MRMILPMSVVALTVLGGGLLRSSSIAASRQQPGADGTAADVFTDYADETTGTITRVFPGSERSYNFLQATGFREGRSGVAQLTPIDTFEPSDADDEISLPTGDIVITQPYIRN